MLEPAVLLRPSVVALAASMTLLAACQRDEPLTDPLYGRAPAAAPAVAVAPPPVLDRAALLLAMDREASVYAAGKSDYDASIVGRRFVIRQAFGCSGAGTAASEMSGDGAAFWGWADEGRSLRLSLTPADWKDSSFFADGAEAWEAVEGFWLPRPWLRTGGCPDHAQVSQLANGSISSSPQTAGLASVYDKGGSRLVRRNGRAYAFTLRGQADRPPAAPLDGFTLVLEGRMAAFVDGRAIRCRASSPDQRPVCIGAVQLDRVAFETAEGQTVSEWRD
jgi:hypothetical protein